MKVSLVLASLFASALAAPSFSSQYELDGGNRRREGGSLIDRLRDDKRFSRFVEVLEKERGLRDDLENRDKETTVFVPTDDAFERMEDEWRESRNENKPNMRDVLRYHIAGDSRISEDSMHAGSLIPTNLRLKSLEDRHQRIRVFRFHDITWLNMKARIIESDIKADNGRIHAIDRVLCPPQEVTEMMYTVPTQFSTTLAAFERTGLMSELEREKALTVFAPNNRAWKALGYENLKYLFSCAGQKREDREGRDRDRDEKDRRDRDRDEDERRPMCKGVRDLKKILQNHVAKKLAYSTDFMDKETTELRTLGNAKITVCAKKQQGRDEDRNRRDEDEDKKHRDVRRYNFVVNDGEARITFNDGLASNGAIQMISGVLVGDIRLPHERIEQ